MDDTALLWDIFTGLGFKIHSTESIDNESFDGFIHYDNDEKISNIKNAEYQFGDEMRAKQWGEIFKLADKNYRRSLLSGIEK